jgi:hypothetical protein
MGWSRSEAHCLALAMTASCIFILTTYMPCGKPALLLRPRLGRKQACARRSAGLLPLQFLS